MRKRTGSHPEIELTEMRPQKAASVNNEQLPSLSIDQRFDAIGDYLLLQSRDFARQDKEQLECIIYYSRRIKVLISQSDDTQNALQGDRIHKYLSKPPGDMNALIEYLYVFLYFQASMRGMSALTAFDGKAAFETHYTTLLMTFIDDLEELFKKDESIAWLYASVEGGVLKESPTNNFSLIQTFKQFYANKQIDNNFLSGMCAHFPKTTEIKFPKLEDLERQKQKLDGELAKLDGKLAKGPQDRLNQIEGHGIKHALTTPPDTWEGLEQYLRLIYHVKACATQCANEPQFKEQAEYLLADLSVLSTFLNQKLEGLGSSELSSCVNHFRKSLDEGLVSACNDIAEYGRISKEVDDEYLPVGKEYKELAKRVFEAQSLPARVKIARVDFPAQESADDRAAILKAVGNAVEIAKQIAEKANRDFNSDFLATYYTDYVEKSRETVSRIPETSDVGISKMQYALSKQNGICVSVGVGVGVAIFVLLLAFSTGGLSLLLPLSIAAGVGTYSLSTMKAYPHYKSTVMKAGQENGCLQDSRKMVEAEKADGMRNPPPVVGSTASSGANTVPSSSDSNIP